MRKILLMVLSLFCFGLLAGCYGAHGLSIDNNDNYEQGLVDKAAQTVRSMRSNQKFRNLDTYLRYARGVLVLPGVIKAGLIYGGQGGNGVLLERDKDGWSAPAFYTLGGGSFGLQIGVQETAIVLVFMNENALRSAIETGLTLGADATVAAGSEGLSGDVSSTHVFKDVYYFADVNGLFVGVSLEGGVIHVRDDLNKSYYGRDITPREILLDHKVDAPRARTLKSMLTVTLRSR
jgi:SH3 domain-containing YSC84-like protein 1